MREDGSLPQHQTQPWALPAQAGREQKAQQLCVCPSRPWAGSSPTSHQRQDFILGKRDYQPKQILTASVGAQAVRGRKSAASSDFCCHLPTLPFPPHTTPSCRTCRSPRGSSGYKHRALSSSVAAPCSTAAIQPMPGKFLQAAPLVTPE